MCFATSVSRATCICVYWSIYACAKRERERGREAETKGSQVLVLVSEPANKDTAGSALRPHISYGSLGTSIHVMIVVDRGNQHRGNKQTAPWPICIQIYTDCTYASNATMPA